MRRAGQQPRLEPRAALWPRRCARAGVGACRAAWVLHLWLHLQGRQQQGRCQGQVQMRQELLQQLLLQVGGGHPLQTGGRAWVWGWLHVDHPPLLQEQPPARPQGHCLPLQCAGVTSRPSLAPAAAAAAAAARVPAAASWGGPALLSPRPLQRLEPLHKAAPHPPLSREGGQAGGAWLA